MESQFSKKNQNYKTYLILLVILLIGTFLRLYGLGSKGLWGDEIGEVLVAKTIIDDISLSNIGTIQGIYYHLSPPLDYIILHFVLLIGDSEFLIRLPAAIFGSLSIIVIFFLGKELYGEEEGLISSFLLSISIFAINYSQEARMYSLFMFLSLLSLFIFYRINKTHNNWKYWLLLTIVNVAIIYTHYFGFFVLFIEGIYLTGNLVWGVKNGSLSSFLRHKGNLFITFCISSTITLALFIPWFTIFRYQTSSSYYILYYGLQPNLSFIYILGFFFTGSVPLAISFLILLLANILSFSKYIESNLVLSMWICVPIIVVAILTWVLGSVSTPRNLIFILPLFLILISHGIVQVSEYLKFITVNLASHAVIFNKFSIICTILALLLILSLIPIQNQYTWKKDNCWRSTGQFLEMNVDNTDLIVLIGSDDNVTLLRPDNDVAVLQFYYHGQAKIISTNYDSYPPVTFPLNFSKVWYVVSPFSNETDLKKSRSRLKSTFFEENETLGIYSFSEPLGNSNHNF